eukprot:COSAG02_NODE_17853_length_976_cov_1.033067_1_plen_96_part_10
MPFYINVDSGRFTKTTLTLGARADSYYEYLLKQWLLSGKSSKPKELRFLKAYEEVRSARNLAYKMQVSRVAAVWSRLIWLLSPEQAMQGVRRKLVT